MKRIILIGGTVGALFVGVSALAAGGTKSTDPAAHRAEKLDHIFELLDANADGAIDRAEIEARHEARFAAADLDGDGLLTADEMRAAAAKRAERRIAGMVSRLDKNGDGAIARDEFAAMSGGRFERRGARMFERFDANGDGQVTREEAERHMEKRHKRWHDG